MKKILVSFYLILMVLSLMQAQQISSDNSLVNFSIKNLKVRTVTGTFSGMQGEISFDPSDLENSRFLVSIDPASVNTGNKKRDKHLRSEDFFHVEAYPLISFTSTSIQKTEEGFSTRGTLSMRGIEAEVEIPFTYSSSRFTGTLEIKRLDYEVGEGTGTFTAGEIANLEIVAVLN